nr:flowering-promoting factor 1-like protein 3 [Ipomoea batatas]
MSGVWVFKNGVVRLVENPGEYQAARKMLIHVRTNEVITSYAVLERKLMALGWERYYDEPELLQYHKRSTVHLISLPRDFNKFRAIEKFVWSRGIEYQRKKIDNYNWEGCIQITEGDPRSWHFSSQSTPFGIELRIALSTAYKEHSPRVGLLDASSAGLQSSCCRFHSPKMYRSIKLQIKSLVVVLLGTGGCFSWQSGLENRDQQQIIQLQST